MSLLIVTICYLLIGLLYPDQIQSRFEFFPELHKLIAARPNVNPICLTTAIGPEGFETRIIQPLEEDDFLPEQLDLIPDALDMPLDDQVDGVAITFDNQKSMQMILNEIKINQAAQGMGPPGMPQDCMAAVPGMPLPSHGSASVGSRSRSETP